MCFLIQDVYFIFILLWQIPEPTDADSAVVCSSVATTADSSQLQPSAVQLLSSRPGVNYQAEGIMKRLRDRYTG